MIHYKNPEGIRLPTAIAKHPLGGDHVGNLKGAKGSQQSRFRTEKDADTGAHDHKRQRSEEYRPQRPGAGEWVRSEGGVCALWTMFA